ncbi:MAG: acetyl-CoA acetyltransferase [Nitrososphaerota archaeon]|nr:acetyl-CoA acetyltransferase [Nitrososphaerota archaeon]
MKLNEFKARYPSLPVREVAIIGIGASKFDSITAGQSYKELMYEAAKKAYSDAGVDAREDVGSFICCAEDFWEGNSISDEYMPDQIGAKLRPLMTVSGDGLLGLAHGYMHIMAGVTDVVVVESHSKLSDVVSKRQVENLGFDPLFARLRNVDPKYLAGLEMRRYLEESGNSVEDCASVVVKNCKNALRNPRAVYGNDLKENDVLSSEEIAAPLRDLEISKPADCSVVLVLATAKKARRLSEKPIWISGISWFSDSPNVEDMDLGQAIYAANSSQKAYKMARITRPSTQLDFAEIDDTFAYKELQHIEALGLAKRAGKFITSGKADREGILPVNPSGGSLGMGYFAEATSLVRTLEAVLQLRGEAGPLQIQSPRRCVVQSWRRLPTQSGATAVLSR